MKRINDDSTFNYFEIIRTTITEKLFKFLITINVIGLLGLGYALNILIIEYNAIAFICLSIVLVSTNIAVIQDIFLNYKKSFLKEDLKKAKNKFSKKEYKKLKIQSRKLFKVKPFQN